MEQFLSLAAYIFLGVLGLISIFDGTRRLVVRDRSKSAAVTLMLGFVICASYSGMNFIKYKTVSTIIASVEKAKIQIPPENGWNKDLTPERREAIREMDARLEFFESGKLKSFEDKTGKKKMFAPSQSDIRDREQMVLKVAELNELSDERYLDIFRGIFAGMFAAVIGLWAGRRNRTEAANSIAAAGANLRESS